MFELRCDVKACCESKQLAHCGVCPQFPCEMLSAMGTAQSFDPAVKIEQCRVEAAQDVDDVLQARMKSGALYDPGDEKLLYAQTQCLEKLYDFNQTRPSQSQKRQELLREILAEVGERCYVEPPLHANWGKNTHFGHDVYANFNLTLVDDGDIIVGNHVMFGPHVIVATAGHPIAPTLRKRAIQYNIPVCIGNNVWIGAGAIILPGVTIGDNTVIGAGSVVTKDVPPNVVAVGNPCKVLREIGAHDQTYYYKQKKIDIE